MKTRDEFIDSVFAKAKKAKKKRMRLVSGAVAAAACVMLAVGIGSGGFGELIDSGGIGNIGTDENFAAWPVVDGPADELTDETGEKSESAETEALQGDDFAQDDALVQEEFREKAGTKNQMKKASESGKTSENAGNENEEDNISRTSTYGISAYTEYPEEAQKINNLSIDIFKQAASSSKNSMVSPISVLTAMGMVENGAKGNTKKEIEEAFGMKTEAMTGWIKEWIATQKHGGREGKTKINIANAFWYNKSIGLKPASAYKKTLKSAFGAEIKGGSFTNDTVNQINKWVDKQTDGMIKKLVDRLNPGDAAVIANAVAFQDRWLEPYSKSRVKKENFTLESGKTKKMKLMYSTEETYFHDALATGFSKPYEYGYEFVAILPNEGVTVKEYMAQMTGEGFAEFLDSAEEARVNAVMPAFKSEFSTDEMVKILKDMGIKDVFSSSDADLSGIGKADGQNIFVSDIIHKTYIEVDREGTKAAAVTGVIMKATSMMPQPLKEYTVRLDRPYIYAIVDSKTKIPVFMGTMLGA